MRADEGNQAIPNPTLPLKGRAHSFAAVVGAAQFSDTLRMLPVVALVGRPNVGKSTLFNVLTRTRDALVHDLPGLTRDRHYGICRLGEREFVVVDTGGLSGEKEGIDALTAHQAELAIDEADIVALVVDARDGVLPQDRNILGRLRKHDKPLLLIVNKIDGVDEGNARSEFASFGFAEPVLTSSAHSRGLSELLEAVEAHLPAVDADALEAADPTDEGIRVAIVGRPNVGKSTLVNRLLGEDRVVVSDIAGTTRDSIRVPLERDGKKYTLIDTAGVRRRARVEEAVEKFSVIKTLQSIEDANVVILVLDAQHEISEQDAHIAGFILEAGRALVVAVNKWDHLDQTQRDQIKREFARKLEFLHFARTHFVSALEGKGLAELIKSIDLAYAAAMAKLSTPKLTRALIAATTRQPPPRHGLFRPKMRYAHQGGVNPPVIVIHGNQLDRVPDSYRRYLERYFTDLFRLQGTPVRIQFKVSANPYSERH